jgi:hypothetical protein
VPDPVEYDSEVIESVQISGACGKCGVEKERQLLQVAKAVRMPGSLKNPSGF